MVRKYFEANPRALKNKHLLSLHEALHAAVCEALGFAWEKIVLKKTTGFINWEWESGSLKWREAAVCLAPTLIDDMSDGDENLVKKFTARTRGYAWRWLKNNREALMERANEIAAKTDGPGTLWNKEGQLVWRAKHVQTKLE